MYRIRQVTPEGKIMDEDVDVIEFDVQDVLDEDGHLTKKWMDAVAGMQNDQRVILALMTAYETAHAQGLDHDQVVDLLQTGINYLRMTTVMETLNMISDKGNHLTDRSPESHQKLLMRFAKIGLQAEPLRKRMQDRFFNMCQVMLGLGRGASKEEKKSVN